jgi:hypothetical protein
MGLNQKWLRSWLRDQGPENGVDIRGRTEELLRNTNIWELDLIFISHCLLNNRDCNTHLSYLATFYQSGDFVFLPTLNCCGVCEEAVKVVETVPISVDTWEVLKKSHVHLKTPTTTRTGTQVT